MTSLSRTCLRIHNVRQQLLLRLPESSHIMGPYEMVNSLEETVDIEQAALTYITALKKKTEEQELEISDLKTQICRLKACLSEQEDDPEGGVVTEKAKGGSTEVKSAIR